MAVLLQFVVRLSFGLALAMAVTSPRQVTSGFFRNHLYVLLGLNVLGSLVAWSRPEEFALWPPVAAAVASYIGAVAWLYEKPRAGLAALVTVTVLSLVGGLLEQQELQGSVEYQQFGLVVLWAADVITGGMLLGFTIAAMFLGHWYLNSPTMELAPLDRLLTAMYLAVAARVAVSGLGLALTLASDGIPGASQLSFLTLRWLAGVVGLAVLVWMSRQTLRIPNTQSATGILYVAVIATFLGELTAQLLSRSSDFPL